MGGNEGGQGHLPPSRGVRAGRRVSPPAAPSAPAAAPPGTRRPPARVAAGRVWPLLPRPTTASPVPAVQACAGPRGSAAPRRTPAGLPRPRPAPPPGRRCPPPPPCAAQPRSGRGRLSGAAEPARPFVCGRAGAVPALQCQPGAGWGRWPGHRADSRPLALGLPWKPGCLAFPAAFSRPMAEITEGTRLQRTREFSYRIAVLASSVEMSC